MKLLGFMKMLADGVTDGMTDLDNELSKIPGKGGNAINAGSFVQTILNWVYAVAGLVAVGFIVYGAINYVMTQGDPGKIKQAGQTIAFAVIGLIVVLVAAAITNFVIGSLGV